MVIEEAVCDAQFFFLRLSPITKRSGRGGIDHGERNPFELKKTRGTEYKEVP